MSQDYKNNELFAVITEYPRSQACQLKGFVGKNITFVIIFFIFFYIPRAVQQKRVLFIEWLVLKWNRWVLCFEYQILTNKKKKKKTNISCYEKVMVELWLTGLVFLGIGGWLSFKKQI